MSLPDLSRFELQCLQKLWSTKQATVREIWERLADPPSYSTVRKIIERLEDKGAVERVRMDGKAVVYRSTVSSAQMIRKEIRHFLDTVFDGASGPLVSHLADMEELTIEDLKEVEERLEAKSDRKSGGRKGKVDES